MAPPEPERWEPASYFSPDYTAARARFRDAAHAAGARVEALPIEARGPAGESLTIDIACLGAPGARRVLLHTSGIHGVEAFAGSAVQLAALARRPVVPGGCALMLVHVLNPYGMAWLRRFNESNVDLNRNFLGPGERWEGASPLYRHLDPLLNPPTPPAADGFYLRLALFALRYGMHGPRQAIAEGQYEFPRGLFYGGAKLEAGPRLFLDWLSANVAGAAHLFAIDLHTGLGGRDADTVIREPGIASRPAAELSQALHREVVDAEAGEAAYRIRGGMAGAVARVVAGAHVDFVVQEMGTFSSLAVLHALREENRCHHYAPADMRHPARLALLETFCPPSHGWRARAVERGVALLHAAAAWTFRDEPKSPHEMRAM
jgi:hypothetical protein